MAFRITRKKVIINAIRTADFEIEQVLGHSNFADDEIEDAIRDADAEHNADIEGELLNCMSRRNFKCSEMSRSCY